MDVSPRYEIGNPTLKDLWVDPVSGADDRDGQTRGTALRSITAAWQRIPENFAAGAHGWRIRLCPGIYPPGNDGHINLAGRRGTRDCPIILAPADAPLSAELPQFNVTQCSHLYVLNLKFASAAVTLLPVNMDNVVHFADCQHILLRGIAAHGVASPTLPRLVFKANQCSHLYVEDSEFSDAAGCVYAYVAVQHGHIVRSRFSGAAGECVCLKGGSAYHLFAGNEVSHCGNHGFIAGQGTGFPYLVSPWLHYEAYDIKVVNNVFHDTGSAFSVAGGYNILLAYNTAYRVGSNRDTIVVGFGSHIWINDPHGTSERYYREGGWCPRTGDACNIPNRNIQICNNIIYNPDGYESAYAHFGITGPLAASAESQIPSPAENTNLVIAGNIVWNGSATKPVLDDVENCWHLAAKPAINPAELQRHNQINTLRPELIAPEKGDLRPRTGGSVYKLNAEKIPDFTWKDAPTKPAPPPGNPDNSVPLDRDGRPRLNGTVGAYA
jgi:hypothetical protein